MLTRFLSVTLLLVFASGCGLHAQTYVMTKSRVGIEKGSGNAGYITGIPQFVEPQRKTRKIYVFEITKALPESEVKKIEQEIATVPAVNTAVNIPASSTAAPAPAAASSNKIVIPKIEDETPAAPVADVPSGPTEAVTYTVQKDDTLQKIAKKYYGSYGAWMKIYKANKDKIKNPNLLRSGTVITIPAAK